jgi:hypothetical protein
MGKIEQRATARKHSESPVQKVSPIDRSARNSSATTAVGRKPEYKFHPLADIFPLMEGEEFDALVADIKANGLIEPLVMLEGMILDGRNRYHACVAADVEPTFRPFTGDGPAAYVISANIHRRHLTPEQKRDLIAKLIKAQPGKSDRQIAKTATADHKTVASVRVGMEGRGEIPHVETRTDTKGRRQSAKKKARVAKPVAKPTMAATTTAAKGRKAKNPEARSSAPEREAVRAQQDIGPASIGEVERLRARVDELQAEKRQLEIKIAGLESEIEELKAKNAELRAKLEAAGASRAQSPAQAIPTAQRANGRPTAEGKIQRRIIPDPERPNMFWFQRPDGDLSGPVPKGAAEFGLERTWGKA